MSGHSYDSTCPNCNASMDCYSDHKPFDYVSGECLECGFQYWTVASQSSIQDLNSARLQRNEDMGYEDEDKLSPLQEMLPINENLEPYIYKDTPTNLLIEAIQLLQKETGWIHMPDCPAFGRDGDKQACNCSKAKEFLNRPVVKQYIE